MKFATLLSIMSLTAVLNTAVAADIGSAEDDTLNYCNDQAAMAGIEDAAEKAQYVKECVESFDAPAGEGQSQAD